MDVSQVMTRNVECIGPDSSLTAAALKMKQLDIGPLPVCGEEDRLVGMITDRDIVIRAVADGRDMAKTKVQDVMTPEVEYVLEDQPVEEAARIMREKQIRRLVVLDHKHRLVGILSLGDLAVDGEEEMVGEALEGISYPAAPRR